MNMILSLILVYFNTLDHKEQQPTICFVYDSGSDKQSCWLSADKKGAASAICF